MKPTKEQIEAAHKWFDSQFLRDMRQQRAITADMLEILLAATTPDPGPPRPDDRVELARLVALELRSRGILARLNEFDHIEVPRYPRNTSPQTHVTQCFTLRGAQFNNLTPRECADVIQAEEAKKAAEWAGDAS